MKKLFVLLMTISVLFSFNSCNWFKNNDETILKELVVENVISADREYMFANYDTTYVWYESEMILNNFLDEECDGTIEKITDVFQVVNHTDSVNVDAKVVKITHTKTESLIEVIDGFWLEDNPLYDDCVVLTYNEAFQLMMESNYVKPHSRNCTLRSEVGPVAANPQYIFGNLKSQLYVDAVDGDVSDKSPSFLHESNDEVVE